MGILEALEGGPVEAVTLARMIGATEGSTRRALRALAAAGRVGCLGYGAHGKRWGLPEHIEAARDTWAEVWPAARQGNVAQIMGARFALSLRRALVGAL